MTGNLLSTWSSRSFDNTQKLKNDGNKKVWSLEIRIQLLCNQTHFDFLRELELSRKSERPQSKRQPTSKKPGRDGAHAGDLLEREQFHKVKRVFGREIEDVDVILAVTIFEVQCTERECL